MVRPRRREDFDRRRCRRLVLCIGILCLCSVSLPVAQDSANLKRAMKGVVFIKVDFDKGPDAYGTGFFVDHDGLVATAEHVIYQYKNVDVKGEPPKVPDFAPKTVTIYSPSLRKEWPPIDCDVPGSVLRGRDLGSPWRDVALLRIKLDDPDRTRMVALDVLREKLETGVRVTALGSGEDFIKGSSRAEVVPRGPMTLTVPQSLHRSDLVATAGTLIPRGYSGGPLVTDDGLAAGITSGGQDFYGDTTERQYYAKASSLMLLPLERLPSTYLTSLQRCETWASWEGFTELDLRQIRPSLQTKPVEKCTCLCVVLDRNPIDVPPPEGPEEKKRFMNCASMRCKAELLLATLHNLIDSETSASLSEGARSARVGFAMEIYHHIDANPAATPESSLAVVRRSYGDFLSKVVLREMEAPFWVRYSARSEALAALSGSVGLQPEQPHAWRTIAGLVAPKDRPAAVKALALAKHHGLSNSAFQADQAYLSRAVGGSPPRSGEAFDPRAAEREVLARVKDLTGDAPAPEKK